MSTGWKIWIVILLMADFPAAIGLWFGKTWAIALFILIAVAQLIAYVGFRGFFGEQSLLIVFHVVSLVLFAFLSIRQHHGNQAE